MQKPTKENDKR